MARTVSFLLTFAAVACGQGHPPDGAAARTTVPDGFSVRLVACEPVVRQPVAIDFDERGRLWVLQYLQYPNPAGLKLTESRVSTTGVTINTYVRAGEVETGSFAMQNPSKEELRRRERLKKEGG